MAVVVSLVSSLSFIGQYNGGHSVTGIVWNVDLEKVDENQLDRTPIHIKFT